jgi:hypothetical protein
LSSVSCNSSRKNKAEKNRGISRTTNKLDHDKSTITALRQFCAFVGVSFSDCGRTP